MRRLANAMVADGVAVELWIAKGASHPIPMTGLDPAVQISALPRLGRAALTLEILLRLRRKRPPLLLAFEHRAALLSARAGVLARGTTHLWISPRNALSAQMAGWPARRRARRVAQMRWVHRRAKGVIAISDGLARDYAEVLGVPPEEVTTIYNPVLDDDLAVAASAPWDPPWEKHGDLPLIVSVGRLTRQKDVATLIRAFAQLRCRIPARLAVIGEGEDRGALEGLAQDLGVADHLWLPGFLDNPYPVMAAASVFVLASRWEGFGNVLAEALALGLPVVSTDCPHGPAEILDAGRYGELVAVGDPSALAAATERVLRSPPSPQHQRAGAERFRAGAVASRYLQVMGLA